jgi:enoyl-CoA hydratase/carnithine racemase
MTAQDSGGEAPAGELVTSRLEDGVLVLAWNRPHRRNAWTKPMGARYFELLDKAADDPEVRAIVLTGTGDSFCPGMDALALGDVADHPQDTSILDSVPETFPTTIPKPIVAAINGPCVGVGLLQALTCDVRFAARGVKIGTMFSRRGIMAEQGAAWLLSRLVGAGVAMDLLLSGRVLLAEEALRIGLVNQMHEPAELLPAAIGYARELAEKCSPLAMAAIKDQIYHAQTASLEQSRVAALSIWTQVLKPYPDFREGITSYMERRPPRFRPITRADVTFSAAEADGG